MSFGPKEIENVSKSKSSILKSEDISSFGLKNESDIQMPKGIEDKSPSIIADANPSEG